MNTRILAADPSSLAQRPLRVLSEDLFKDLPIVRVVQEKDVLYGKRVQYEAVPLDSLLQAGFPDIQRYLELGYYLVLRAGGGYEPMLPLAEAMSGNAFVTRKIAGTAPDEPYPCWEEAGDINCNPEYFVVWNDGYYPERPQPWGVFELELLPSQYLSQALGPESDSPDVVRGAATYRKYCIECHSIHGVGGGVATDHGARDTPVRKETLRFFLYEFAKRSSATSMPNFSGVLNDEDVSDLHVYLKHMFTVHSTAANGEDSNY